MSRRPTSRATVRPTTPADGAIRGLPSNPIVDGDVVTMAALAPRLGKNNPRAVRDWCQTRGVPYRRDGKHNWVVVADIYRAIARMPQRCAVQGSRDAAAMAAVAAMKLTGRR
jgi:hypothetical protein